MKRDLYLAFSILPVLFLCISLDAANAQIIRRRAVPAMQPTETNQAAASEQFAGQHDWFLANWIGADNQTEIQLSQFALQRTSNQDLKNFLQEMIRDHSDLANKLNQAVSASNASARSERMPYTAAYGATPGTVPAAPAAPTPPTEAPAANAPQVTAVPAAPGAPENAPGNPVQPGSPPAVPTAPANVQPGAAATMPGGANAASGMPHTNVINFKRQIDAQLATNIEQKLGQEKGQDFDRCFLSGQIAGHMHLIATLEVAKNQASPQLKAVLDEGLSVAQKHLNHAESLLAKLEPQKR